MTDGIDQSANSPHPARAGGEFFTAPATGPHRRYEALRAYLLDGRPAADVAALFGYTTAGLHSAVADFRAGSRDFFTDSRPGPRTAPGKNAARTRIIELRAEDHSIDEIGAVLTCEGTPLNRTGINEVIAQAALPRIWRRPDALRGGPRRDHVPRARALQPLEVSDLPADAPTRMAGLLLRLPDLLALHLPALAGAAGYPLHPGHPSPQLPAVPASGPSAI